MSLPDYLLEPDNDIMPCEECGYLMMEGQPCRMCREIAAYERREEVRKYGSP